MTALPWRTQLGRRGMLGVGLSAAAVARALASGPAAAQGILKVHTGEITALALSPDGGVLVSAAKDLQEKIWKPFEPGAPVLTPPRSLPVNALAVARNGGLLVAAAPDKSIQHIRLPEGSVEGEAPRGSKYFNGLAVSPGGELIAFGGWDKAPHLWFAGAPDYRSLAGHAKYVTAVALGPDSKRLLSGSWDATMRVWSLPEGECLRVLEGHTGYIEHVRFLAGGRRAVSGASDGTIRLWSLEDYRELARFDFGAGPVRVIAASPEGKRLYAACGEAALRVLDREGMREEPPLEGHRAAITALAYAEAGTLLASGDAEGAVILWDGPAGKLHGYLFDEKANWESARRYNVYDRRTNTVMSYSMPCGTPIPPGSTCTCNCVRGAYTGGGGVPSTRCACDQVCTCVPVQPAHGGAAVHLCAGADPVAPTAPLAPPAAFQ